MEIAVEKQTAPLNHILGVASSNVPAYSNMNDEIFYIERNFFHGIFTGVKWQCVEYARRWLLIRKSCIFGNVPCAADIWTQITHVERITDGRLFSLKPHPNGSTELPRVDSFLIYSRSEGQPVGHIAIICAVGENFIRIAEQNNKFHYWESDYAREIPVSYSDGRYHIQDEDTIEGWMEIEDDEQLKPFAESMVNSILPKYQQPQSVGTIRRAINLLQSTDMDTVRDWLNKEEPAENLFATLYGEKLHRHNDHAHALPYYKINQDFIFSIAEASNELHRMLLQATDHVIRSDELLTQFNIPNIFWSRLRQSWTREQNSDVTGRLDLGFDGRNFKIFEYEADCASTLFECAIVQRKWAKAASLPSTFMSGFRLHETLINKWKKMNVKTTVHILIDDNSDQHLTALYMQNVLKEAGIDSKIFLINSNFFWKNNQIIDRDDMVVRVVWKLCRWNTILEDYLAASEERGLINQCLEKINDGWIPVDGIQARLSDILLHEEIQIIEPMWKVITSHKGLLSVLWDMHRNHSLLLETQWNLTDELKKSPFVEKPTFGQHSHNIIVHHGTDEALIQHKVNNSSDGKVIYQKLFDFKNESDFYAVLGSWIVFGHFAGFSVREDHNIITNTDSPVIPCCIIWKEED